MIKKKKDTIKSLAINAKDVGSTEIQIGLLTEKISKMSEKFYETNITLINTHNIMEKIVKEKNIKNEITKYEIT